MTLSLDTHTFLWWLDDPQLLSKAARKAIGDGKNTVYVSAAVIWEIVIKRALGKLDAPDDLEAAMAANRFLPLPVTITHALAVQSLPDHHRDPFDRLLIAQARHEGFKLVSRDPIVARYGVAHIVA
jgi:PIN domain nuclease of toxin-antitoxin system